jgi:hypothetical protein
MPSILTFRRGTAAQNDAFTGSAGEITVDSTNGTIRVHDGVTAGGSQVATASTLGALASQDTITESQISDFGTYLTSITSNSIGANELNVSGNGTSGQALVSDGDGSFSWGAGGDSFGTLTGPYYNGGTFANSYGATTLRTVSLPAGKYFIMFNSTNALQTPTGDPDGVTVQFREDSNAVVTHNHEETDPQAGGLTGPTAAMTTTIVRTYGTTQSVNVYVPAGGDGDGGGVYLKTNILFYKLD